jgi:hypothetical protein
VSDLPGLLGGRRVSTYKKCHADEVGKQYRALTTVPTIMRLSVLALFIALPAAAYAAVYPRQNSLYPKDTCGDLLSPCKSNEDCCPGFHCDTLNEDLIVNVNVCLIVHFL